jgi:hypothetical protein
MSCRRPKLTYRRRTVQPSRSTQSPFDNANFAVISVSDAPRPKRPRNSKNLVFPGPEELVTLPGGVSLTQIQPTSDITTSTRYPRGSKAKRKRSISPFPGDTSADENLELPDHPASGESNAATKRTDLLRRQNAQLKKARTSYKWTNDVLPTLLPLYLRLLRETESLRLTPNAVSFPCTCTSARTLAVTCIFFKREY